jgi:hypothetical protein
MVKTAVEAVMDVGNSAHDIRRSERRRFTGMVDEPGASCWHKAVSPEEVVMSRATLLLAALAFAAPVSVIGQVAHFAPPAQGAAQEPAARPMQKMTDAQKITNAMSAAPASISKNATIMDWAAAPSGQPRQLRAGTNGWVCYPTSPMEFGAASDEDPMCLDKAWQGWASAWMSKGQPPAGASGIAYMLKGDKGASNTDPFATGPAAGNDWVVSPAHVMVLFADSKTLDMYPTDPKSGGPWVMWKGTPYAHLMVPVSASQAATMK